MDVMKLLEYLQEILETSHKVPLTGKIVISQKEAMDTIEKIISCLPDEFKKAQWVYEEKERILNEAIEQAEQIKKENINMFRKQIENHDIVKEAKVRADEIIAEAKKNAKDMRLGARDYADEILSQLDKEISLKGNEMINTVNKDVNKLIADLQHDVSLRTDTIRDNIKELRDMKK